MGVFFWNSKREEYFDEGKIVLYKVESVTVSQRQGDISARLTPNPRDNDLPNKPQTRLIRDRSTE